MAKADVIALAQLFAVDQASAANLSTFYDEAVRTLGLHTGHLSALSLVTGVAAQAEYTAPVEAIRILAVFYNDLELFEETLPGLASACGTDWRQHPGDPIAYIRIDTTDKTIRLYPVPTLPGDSYIPLTGLFGASYPGYNVFIAHTEERADVPGYLELYLALTILTREYTRDSDHQDRTYAIMCDTLAKLALAAVGL